jgi:hypothetical protein
VQGACIPNQLVDAGIASVISDAGPSPLSTKDFASVDASVSWTQQVQVPKREVTIAGGDARLLGSWRQRDCDTSNMSFQFGCLWLDIAQSADGSVRGSVNFDRTFDVRGPFKPPQDPDRGYPIEVSVNDYSTLSFIPQARVPYRILDGSFANDRLTFSWSYLDIWHDWCALQHPYPWQIDDQRFYYCVPQDAEARSMIDEGKDILCTSADFEPLCPDEKGNLFPCICSLDVSKPHCSRAYCRCDSQSCDAELHALTYPVDLTLQDGRLVGTWNSDPRTKWSITLQRESP